MKDLVYNLKKLLSDAFRKLRKITIGKIYHVSDPRRKDIENYFKKSI